MNRVGKLLKRTSLAILFSAFVVAARLSFQGAWKSGPETMGMSDVQKAVYLVQLNLPIALSAFLVLAVIAGAVWSLANIKPRLRALQSN